jgi:hypothetical protein
LLHRVSPVGQRHLLSRAITGKEEEGTQSAGGEKGSPSPTEVARWSTAATGGGREVDLKKKLL